MLNHPDTLLHSFLALASHYGIERQAVDFAEAVARRVAEDVVNRTCADMRSMLADMLADAQISAVSHVAADAAAVQHQEIGAHPRLTVTVWQRKERSSRSVRIAFNRLGQQQAGVMCGHRADVSCDDDGNLVLTLSAGGKYVFRPHSRKGRGARLEALIPAGMPDEVRSYTECPWTREGDRIVIRFSDLAGVGTDRNGSPADIDEDLLPDAITEPEPPVDPAVPVLDDVVDACRCEAPADETPESDLVFVADDERQADLHRVDDHLDAGVVVPGDGCAENAGPCDEGATSLQVQVRDRLFCDTVRPRRTPRRALDHVETCDPDGTLTGRTAAEESPQEMAAAPEAAEDLPDGVDLHGKDVVEEPVVRGAPVASEPSAVPVATPCSDADEIDDGIDLPDPEMRAAAAAIARAARQQERLDQVRARCGTDLHGSSEPKEDHTAALLDQGFSITSRIALKALELDAPRAPAQVMPVSLVKAVELLREAGVAVEPMGPALMKVDGKTMSRPEMIDHLNKVVAGFERGVTRGDVPRYILVT